MKVFQGLRLPGFSLVSEDSQRETTTRSGGLRTGPPRSIDERPTVHSGTRRHPSPCLARFEDVTNFHDRYESHPLHETLRRLETSLNKASDKLSTESATTFHSRIERYRSHLHAVLESLDPELTPIGPLNQLGDDNAAIADALDRFGESGSESELLNASDQVDAALARMALLAPTWPYKELGGFRDAASSFRKSAGQHVTNLRGEVEALRQNTDAGLADASRLQGEIQQQTARIDSAITEFQSNSLSALKGQQDELTQVKASFSEWHTAKNAELTKLATEAQAAVDELIRVRGIELADVLKEAGKQVDDAVSAQMEQIEKRRRQADELLEATGIDTKSANYMSAAKAEGDDADRWRWIAIGSMLLGILTAFVLFLIKPPESGDVTSIVSRALLVGAWAAPAALGIHETSRHRKAQRLNRRIASDIDALEPLLTRMTPEQADPIRQTLLKTMFTWHEYDETSEETVSASALLTLLDSAIKRLAK